MPPELATPLPIQYGIKKDPLALDVIRQLASNVRDQINNAIDDLQFNPYPPGHEQTLFGGFPVVKCVVGQTDPKHLLVYRVDEAKELVFVMVIQETRFAEKRQRAPQKDGRVMLRDLLDKYFSADELSDLCFEMDIDYEKLSVKGKQNTARELILYCERRDLTGELITRCRKQRPNVVWPDA
jgi:hypothetical protein